MTKILSNVLRYITLISVLCGQLLWPYYAYAGVGQQLYPVILNASINGTKMAGTVAGRVIAGNPVLGIAMTSNPAGDAQYDCMVAINPACLPLPTDWNRNSDGTPVPPPSASRDDGANATNEQATQRMSQNASKYCPAKDEYGLNFTGRIIVKMVDANFIYYTCGYQDVDMVIDRGWFQRGKADVYTGTCPAGYTRDGASCTLFAPLNVLKPYGTPCTIIHDGLKFKTDSQNPECGKITDGAIEMSNGTFSVVSDDNVKVYESMVAMRDKTPAATLSLSGDGVTQVRNYDKATNTTTTTSIKDGKVIRTSTEAGNTTGTGTGNGTGTGTGGTPITCQQVGTCGVTQEATQQKVEANTKAISLSMQQIASGLVMGEPIPGITPADYAGTLDQFRKMLPKPDDYRGPVGTMLKSMGFPESGGGQCSLTRTVTLLGRSVTIQFVPNGICGPYQQVANWVTWGLVAIIAWQQVKSLAGDKSDLNKG